MDSSEAQFKKTLKELNSKLKGENPRVGVCGYVEKEIITEMKMGSQSYNDAVREIGVKRMAIFNKMIEDLVGHLSEEHKNKNESRKEILKWFGIFLAIVTAAIFGLLYLFTKGGYDENEVVIAKYLMLGVFGNVIGLATVIFKYLFDGKNSLLQGLTTLAEKTIEAERDMANKRER